MNSHKVGFSLRVLRRVEPDELLAAAYTTLFELDSATRRRWREDVRTAQTFVLSRDRRKTVREVVMLGVVLVLSLGSVKPRDGAERRIEFVSVQAYESGSRSELLLTGQGAEAKGLAEATAARLELMTEGDIRRSARMREAIVRERTRETKG